MPIRFTYDKEIDILFTTAEGIVTFEDIQEHLDDEVAARAIGYRELFDASTATTNLTSGEVRQLVLRLRTLAREAPFGPTSVVTTNDMFFGMSMMLAILSDLHDGPKVAVFRTFDEGLDWLVRASV